MTERFDFRAWRSARNLSIRKSALWLGVSWATVARWERAGGVPRYILLLCDAVDRIDETKQAISPETRSR